MRPEVRVVAVSVLDRVTHACSIRRRWEGRVGGLRGARRRPREGGRGVGTGVGEGKGRGGTWVYGCAKCRPLTVPFLLTFAVHVSCGSTWVVFPPHDGTIQRVSVKGNLTSILASFLLISSTRTQTDGRPFPSALPNVFFFLTGRNRKRKPCSGVLIKSFPSF